MSAEDVLGIVGIVIADKYEVLEVAGDGGQAVVYRAMHKVWKRPVALKVFRDFGTLTDAQRAQVMETFVKEGQLLAELSERSAAIVQARDVGILTTPRGVSVPYMVLEWLEGQSLDTFLESERAKGAPPLTLQEAIRLLAPVGDALALAHARGIAHRDVKPSNIVISGDPRGENTVKLLDFGIAKVVTEAQKLAGGFSRTTGTITSFTPAYGAPEQFSRSIGATGPWTDVFALGLVLVECLTFKMPLDGDDVAQLAVTATSPHRRPTPRTLGATIEDVVENVFLRALAVTPADRFPNAGEFWNALRNAVGMESMRGWTQPTPQGFDIAAVEARSSGQLANAADRRSSGSVSVTGPTGVTQGTPVTLGGAAPNAPAPMASADGGGMGAKVVLAGLLGAVLVGGIGYAIVGRAPTPVPTVPTAVPTVVATVAKPTEPTCPEGMIKIPGGKFFMGAREDDKAAIASERPAHQVTLMPYCIDRFEVTTKDYKKAADTGGVQRAYTTNEFAGITAEDHRIYDPLCNFRAVEERGNHPINCVDYPMAVDYCRDQKKRLPTEAEWEFAARGPDGRTYPWGDEEPTGSFLNACGSECVAWAKANRAPGIMPLYKSDDGWATTAPVGSFRGGASRYGVEDVVGNVWEWVADWYGEYAPEPIMNPKGPTEGTDRVIRGGAWNGGYASWLRPSFRFKNRPDRRSHGIGFRCARDLIGAALP
ncbi:MAG: bifunctional serine/threonine-protein kinase/formylglycine-generating enzyme family protein [Polyangiaceae bacterium]